MTLLSSGLWSSCPLHTLSKEGKKLKCKTKVVDFASRVSHRNTWMASGNPFFDEMRSKPEVIDPPQSEDMLDVGEHVNDPAAISLKPNLTVSSSVRELLECPVCLNAMYPPIHQCSNGHTLCSGCKPRVHNRCPTCRHELGNIRCLALEKVAASLELPCKYQSFGCLGIYPYYSKLKHESQCVYRPYNCPYAGSECTVIGDIPYLVAHLKDDHKVDMHNGSTFNHRYVKSNPQEVENATWMLTVAASLELPCKYQSFGCLGIYPYYSKLKHESQCVYRPYNCPYAGSECTVIGDIPYLVAHLKDDHKVDMHNGSTFNHRYVKSNPQEVENATWMLTVFSCFGQYFCLHFEAFQLGMAPVYIAFLRFMGDDNEAKNYSYSLEVGGNGRKMTWQGVPRSVRDSHRKVRDSFDGLIIQRNMALFFSGGDRKELKLRVTGRIWKEQ
ncbi:e3 ubiquitin-protein ligase sinat5 [Quercus suber]|uniref:RING-type E3 ubiquitin transferase n=1 Tax=Quercus suber TaxID=58331 RepID=A0AAW0L5A4_QUESU